MQAVSGAALELWNSVLFILPFLAVLMTVVFVHELGHFSVGRLCGATVEAFSIGMGPELAGFTDRLGTRWRLSAIPIGGYVRFAGDRSAASAPDGEALARMSAAERRETLAGQPLPARAAIVAAGPLANLLLSVVVFSCLAYFGGAKIISNRIGAVVAASPAAAAGFQPGDLVTRADDTPISTFSDLFDYVSGRPGAEIRFRVHRLDQDMTLVATPRAANVSTPFGVQRLGRLGIVASSDAADVTIVHPGPVGALRMGLGQCESVISATASYVGRLFVGRAAPDQLAGPIGIARMSHAAASFGILTLLDLAALLSLSLGLMNLLPVPLLDGGHLMFYFIEGIRGRPLSARVQGVGLRIGLACILALVLFVTANDVMRLLAT